LGVPGRGVVVRAFSASCSFLDYLGLSWLMLAHCGLFSVKLQILICPRKIRVVEGSRGPRVPYIAPTWSQDGPKVVQDGEDRFKIAPRQRKIAQDGPRYPEIDPTWPQDGRKIPQDGPKMAPAWPQDPQHGFEMARFANIAPTWPKMAPGGSQLWVRIGINLGGIRALIFASKAQARR
jgi:hypothetical protein